MAIFINIMFWLLHFIVTLGIFFGISFFVVTFYINNKRKIQPKYHFSGTADTIVDVDLGSDEYEYDSVSPVDSENARKSWNRQNI